MSIKKNINIFISQDLIYTILEGARRLYPKEIVLLLRGKKDNGILKITELIIPPLAKYGKGFSAFPFNRLPFDLSIVGTVHSHPSGNLDPSLYDLNHIFGVVIMIVAFPFDGKKNIAVYNRKGERLILQITK